MSSLLQKKIESNRKKLMSILKTIVFYGTKNIPLKGNAGDMTLNNHLPNSPANATFISHRVQNKILNIRNDIIRFF
jgi:hypothetical protein